MNEIAFCAGPLTGIVRTGSTIQEFLSMTEIVPTTVRRKRSGSSWGLLAALLVACAPVAAQPALPSFDRGEMSAAPSPIAPEQIPSPQFAPPMPGDVLNPDTRTNTPNLKLGVRLGINRSAYSNDRYLNNVLLDVGEVSGETDIYASAAGFGYMIGADLEYPLNQGLSLLLSAEFDHVTFGSSGSVQEPCVDRNGRRQGNSSSIHDFRAVFNFLKLGGAAKLSFSTWYFLAGLTAAHPVSTSLERTRRLAGADCFFPDSNGSQSIEEIGEVPSPTRLHYALRLGGGMIYQITDDLQFSPELTLDFGFGAINKSPNSDLGVYGISATFRYDLR